MTADLPTTRREALLDVAELVADAADMTGVPHLAETLRIIITERAGDYPAAEEHIDPVPHDPDLPRDLGAVERGACGAVIPPLGDICQMTPGHRDHVRTGAATVELERFRKALHQIAEDERELYGASLAREFARIARAALGIPEEPS
jgi:hypothetical protein